MDNGKGRVFPMNHRDANKIRIVIAKNIRQLREESGLTQEELALRLGLVPSAISNWERGANSPDIVQLFMLCEIFGTTPLVLYGMDEDKFRKAYRQASPKSRRIVDIALGLKE
jgi:transcriptional regulator with XRE-family HTH domain